MSENKVTEIDLPCQNSKYSRLDLWACRNTVEIYLAGLIHMQEESLQCNLSKRDALKLADAIYSHFNIEKGA